MKKKKKLKVKKVAKKRKAVRMQGRKKLKRGFKKSPRVKVTKEQIDAMVKKGEERGFLTTSEILYSIPNIERNVSELESIYDLLRERGVQIKEATEFLDVRDFRLPATDDRKEAPLVGKYRAIIARADGLVVVTPEYNHGYPGELKMMLDMAYEEYAAKPVSFCGTGGGMGGVRSVEQLRAVAIELKMVPLPHAVYFSKIKDAFDAGGRIADTGYHERVQKLIEEIVWYARALKRAREEAI